jgi:hypothetical protein
MRISAKLVIATAAAIYALAPSATAQSAESSTVQTASASPQFLDFQFFKSRVEPIFLKRRSSNHARCYACHQKNKHPHGLQLEELSPGSSFWTEEQSRRNFEVVSRFVVPGNPSSSIFPMHPLAPEAGGDAVRLHGGGRQFESKNDPDFQTIEEWIRGGRVQGSSAR